MPKKTKDSLSWSDRNAGRTAKPGTKQQKPSTTTTIRSADGKRKLGSATMNYGGVAGGNPTTDIAELKKRLKVYERSGATKSAEAARARS